MLFKLKVRLSKHNLLNLVDKHFEPYVNQEDYELIDEDARELITHNRLDLAIKIFYLQMKKYKDVLFAEELYIQHINAFSLGSFKEPGNDKKNNIGQHFDVFESISSSVFDHGIDETKSIVPLSKNGSIANGAHRVASAYVAGKKVPLVLIDAPDHIYDFKFFFRRGMHRQDIEIAVTKFIESAENCYVALIWPSAQGRQKEIDALIPNVIYQNNISLNYNGAQNLLTQVYYGETWLGSRDSKYPGAKNKLVKCFESFNDLRVVAFQAKSLDEVLSIKEKVRVLFSIGKHSIHITDTKREAIQTARILFNENSIHFLNYGDPCKYKTTHHKMQKFKSFVNKNDIGLDNVVLDTSIILSLYGIRECRDLDYLSVNTGVVKCPDDLIEDHQNELNFHREEKNNLIFNPALYFYFNELKFISFPQLYKMKKNRAGIKDQNDILLMKALIEHNWVSLLIAKFKQGFYFFIEKTKIKIVDLLKFIGLYKIVRCVYRAFK